MICRWSHPNGRRPRRTKKPLTEGERGERNSWLKSQHPFYSFHTSPPPPPPCLSCPSVCSLCLFTHCCPEVKFVHTIFLDSIYRHQFSSVQLLSRVQFFVTPWIAARQASLSITNSRSLLKLMPIKSVVPSSHLILCRALLLLTPIPPSIRVFSNESSLHMRWLKYWSFSFNISPSNEHPGLISFRMDGLDLLAVQGTLKTLHQYKIFLFLFLISLYIIGSRFLLMYDRKPQNSVRQLSFK